MTNESFPVVCLGGSAGAVEAIRGLLRALPPEPGLSVVVVQHRRGPSILPEVLAASTTMIVELIVEGMLLERDHVYVIPPNCELSISGTVFHLRSVSKSRGWPNVITIFLESLAHSWKGKAIAVILSGLDSDGAAALKAVKSVGGTTFAQKKETAQFPEMPISAIKTGNVDFELSITEIAQELMRIGRANF
jgi:two-component system chemotaxis response regulator CheB